MSNITCVEKAKAKLPEVLVDTTTISIDIDNTGIARMSISVWKNAVDPFQGSCTINLGKSTFKGYIVSDIPQQVNGTLYFDHKISMIGTIID